MLRTMKDLEHYAIHATDGTIGHVQDLYSTTNVGSFAIPSSKPELGRQIAKC